MANVDPSVLADLPANVRQVLANFVESAAECFADDLISVILFGSAAEGRLRPTSDVNVMLVLRQFRQDRVDAFREPLRVARVAVNASVMFIVESELGDAAEAFAVKFDDLTRRRRILFGSDPISQLSISTEAKKRRLRQVLLNLSLRLRQRYATTSLREEQSTSAIAEFAGPLRAAAATLLELEGTPVDGPKEALRRVTESLSGKNWAPILEEISTVRESGTLPAGEAGRVVFSLIELADSMRRRVERLV